MVLKSMFCISITLLIVLILIFTCIFITNGKYEDTEDTFKVDVYEDF